MAETDKGKHWILGNLEKSYERGTLAMISIEDLVGLEEIMIHDGLTIIEIK